MSKTDTPRYTGHGRPVFHTHGSRRALVEQQSDKEAIEESLGDIIVMMVRPCDPAKRRRA